MTGTAELSLARWLPDRAALTPDRVAIDFADKQTSYAELATSAAGWAAVFAAAQIDNARSVFFVRPGGIGRAVANETQTDKDRQREQRQG